jgi:hypothetical protein
MTPLLLLCLAQDYVLLSDVAREVSAQPEFVTKLADQIAILGPDEVARLRGFIRDKQWKALDSFPGITVKNLGRGIRLAARFVGPPSPASAPGPKDIGLGLFMGDELLTLKDNSLAMAAKLNEANPEKLLRQLAADGHTIEIRDSRYFANFGDLKYKGRDVLTPFWLDTGIPIPGQNRNLLVPAPHSQHEIFIAGPKVNASLCFFFGIDGKAIIRPIDTKDQAWVLGHTAHTYKGEQAIEAMRMIGEVIRVYATIQKTNPTLPLGGYYALGVCNDPNAIIETRLTGKTTLYPLTHDKSLFTGYGEVSEIVARLPQDEESTSKDRVIGSLPVADLKQLPLANLRSDLLAASNVSSPASYWLWLVFPLLAAAYFIRRSFSAASR